jgi:hypothetical protein
MPTLTPLRPKALDVVPIEGLDVNAIRELGKRGNRLVMAMAFQEAAERGLMPNGNRMARIVGPQTDAELLDAVENLTQYHIPRNAVCTEHGHTAPATTFCDLYYERVFDVLWIGNRGGGKTTNSGFLHGAKGHWKEGYSSALAGAQAHQGQRGYAEFKRFIRHVDNVISTLLSKTFWIGGGLTEVLGGTVRALNGPHPVLAQLDEAELIASMQVFQEFLNMAQSTDQYQRQQLLTSTRKRAHGIVQQIVKEVDTAIRNGDKAPWRVDIFCVFETMAPVPNCRNAPENAGRPESELCSCDTVVKGTWGPEEGAAYAKRFGGPAKDRPRSFADSCGGKAHRADGFVQLDDVQRRYTQLSRSVWEAQQECLTPDVEGVVHKWVKDRHRLPSWIPWPEFGPVGRGWDWGGQNPHAIVWNQRLEVAVGMVWQDVPTADGVRQVLVPILSDEDDREPAYVIPAGAYVQFDEIYGTASEVGEFSTLGLRAVLNEVRWRQLGVEIVVGKDYCDPAGYIAKREVKKAVNSLIEQIGRVEDGGEYDVEVQALMYEMRITHDQLARSPIRVPEFSSRPAPRYESIRKHIELGEDDMLYYVPSQCPGTDDEYDAYHWLEQKPGKNTPEDAAKEDDHAMDAERYYLYGSERDADTGAPSDAPTALERDASQSGAAKAGLPSKYAPMQTVTRDGSLPGQEAPAVATPQAGLVGVESRKPYGGRLSQGAFRR